MNLVNKKLNRNAAESLIFTVKGDYSTDTIYLTAKRSANDTDRLIDHECDEITYDSENDYSTLTFDILPSETQSIGYNNLVYDIKVENSSSDREALVNGVLTLNLLPRLDSDVAPESTVNVLVVNPSEAEDQTFPFIDSDAITYKTKTETKTLLDVDDLETKTAQIATNGQSLTMTGNVVGANVKSDNETRLTAVEDKAIFNQVNVKDYGAVGDGVTDDTEAINLAISQISAKITDGEIPTILFPSAIGYKMTSGVVFPVGCHVEMHAPIIYFGSSDLTIITVGGVTQESNKNYKLAAYRNTQSDWSSENNIAIKLLNLNNCDVVIDRASNATIGVLEVGDAGAFAYNTIYYNYISNNKYQIQIKSSGSGGYANENLHIGGRYSCASGIGTNLDRYGIHVNSSNSYYNNNNVFIKPCFELNSTAAGTGEAIPILIDYGSYNSFEHIRNESNSTITMRVSNNSLGNKVSVGNGDFVIEDLSTYPTNFGSTVQKQYIERINHLIFKSDSIHKKTFFSNGSTYTNTPGIMQVSGDTNGTMLRAYTYVTPEANYATVTNGIGIFIKTTNNKRFVVRKDVESGYGGRIRVRCYNSNGDTLTSSDIGHPYVKGSSANTFTFATSYGGSYGTGADYDGDVFFEVGEDVDYIVLSLVKGTANLRIRSFAVYAETADCATWLSYREPIPNVNTATTAPTSGTHEAGTILLYPSPSAGGSIGLVCTTAGTPGTWKTFGAIGS